MKLSYIYTLFIIGVVAVFSLASSGGRAGAQGWGNTGAPGDQMSGGSPQTCISCHGTSAAVDMNIVFDIADDSGNAATEYLPGETYSIKVTMDALAGSPSAYGFQMLCLNAAEDVDGAESSSYSNPSSNAVIAMASQTGRTYVEQSSASASNEFTVDWTAPAAGSGIVTFYACGNGVNGNGSTSGDGADCTKIEMAEDVNSATQQIAGLEKMLISPNPTNGAFSLLLQGDQNLDSQLLIHDMNGRLVYQDVLAIQSGENVNQVSFDAPSKGLYLVQIKTASGIRTEKLMVQ